MTKLQFLVFLAFLLPGLTSAQSQAQKAGSLALFYVCEASQEISFASGDRKHKAEQSSQIQWILKEPDNVNLVIGQQDYLLRPHLGKTQGSFQVSLMRRYFGEGYRAVDTQDLTDSGLSFSMSYKNPYSEEVLVKCFVQKI